MTSHHPLARGRLGAEIRRQRGAISRGQLTAAGLSAKQVDGMIASGLLIKRHRGVYLLSNSEPGIRPRLHAALLSLGPRAVLSHRTAGAIWKLCEGSAQIEAIRPGSGAKPPNGVITHRMASLADDEWTFLEGLRVTTVARTLLDLASVLDEDGLTAAFEAADRQGRLHHPAIRRVLDRGGRNGIVALRSHYSARDPRKRPTRSGFEDLVFAAMRKRERFELPETNATIAGREVDMLWRRKRLMIELDGRRHHAGEASFDADRARDLKMERLGYRVIRISWAMWREDPEAVLDSIAAILDSLSE